MQNLNNNQSQSPRDGKRLQPGDEALTHFNCDVRLTRVRIVERAYFPCHCQSGVMFRVAPSLRGSRKDDWFDADWFVPVPAEKEFP